MPENIDNTPTQAFEVLDLSHDGRGIAKINTKTVFIDNAVPGDLVKIKYLVKGDKFDSAQIAEFLTESPLRTQPFCPLFGQCGGCQLQHLKISAQQQLKQQNFFIRLKKSLNPKHLSIEPMIAASDRNYRRRARLALLIDKKDKQPKLGFRASQSNEIIDIKSCPVLSDKLNAFIAENRVHWLSLASRKEREITLVEADNGCFASFNDKNLKGESENPHTPSKPHYQINGLKLEFPLGGFIQVNKAVNEKMIAQAMEWLELKQKNNQPQSRVLDLFCGIGNFTLPIADQAKSITGIEGLQELVDRAELNAAANQIKNAAFFKANLFDNNEKSSWFRSQKYDRILLDPGRPGAYEICQSLHLLKAEIIVYVSCNPATLIRDCEVLQTQGYMVHKACFMDMFPHTTHTEVMVQLKKTKQPKTRDRKKFRF